MNQTQPPDPLPPAEPEKQDANVPQQIVQQVDVNQLQHFVTTIKSAEHQVGENIIAALQHKDTVAVLTTIVWGADGQQRLVSAALKPELMTHVQELLTTASSEREDEEKCVGFHCLVKPRIPPPETT